MAIFTTSVQSKQPKKNKQSISGTTSNCKLLQAKLEVVGFNTSIYLRIQLYQDSETPVLLKDVIVKENESDWLFNQQSTAYPCANSDISFLYEEQVKPETIHQPILSTDATIGQVSTIKANQRVNVS